MDKHIRTLRQAHWGWLILCGLLVIAITTRTYLGEPAWHFYVAFWASAILALVADVGHKVLTAIRDLRDYHYTNGTTNLSAGHTKVIWHGKDRA